MKRFTYWPQIGLGLAFSWGAVMGWAVIPVLEYESPALAFWVPVLQYPPVRRR
jgi:4-hydroxybenzoate polyprenyltransferase